MYKDGCFEGRLLAAVARLAAGFVAVEQAKKGADLVAY